ncbi:pre-peptidase C-terminal domain-containing protein [Asticcacaulis excentricus]|uniref:Alkaline phosphatase n=1 Tax=Asticcacaulis excentricus TaxID=78587 RepID=A0A3G9G3R7_9CAUL|nr:pre-peptidase C-terminal domain-containing protein [Asticcacaulis excentricus]BBF81387.1 alkaline phosphatase [Asticcacaulis excentricus]
MRTSNKQTFDQLTPEPMAFSVFAPSGTLLPTGGVNLSLEATSEWASPLQIDSDLTVTSFSKASSGVPGGSETAFETSTTDNIPANATTIDYLDPANPLTAYVQTTGDVDWIKITLAAGVPIKIQMTGTGTNPLATPSFNIVTANGTVLTSSSAFGANGVAAEFTPTTAGVYYIAASGGTGTGTYQLNYFDTVANEAAVASTAVPMNGKVGGILEGSVDQDFYKVDLVAGQRYVFTAQGVGGDAALGDPSLTLYSQTTSPTGTVSYNSVTSNDDADLTNGNINSVIVYTATTSGTYYLSVRGSTSSYTWERSGSYVVTANENKDQQNQYLSPNPGDIPNGTLAEGASATGTVDFISDKDWYAVTLVAGQTYDFSLFGTGGAGALVDPMLVLYNGSGTRLLQDDDSGPGRNAFISYTATTSGTYYISAQAWSDEDGTYTGTYTLSMGKGFTAGTDTIAAGVNTTATLAVGGTFKGELEKAGDEDWIAVDLVEGQGYRFDLTGSTDLHDTVLYVYDSKGVRIAQDDNGNGTFSQLTFEPVTSGRYYVSAASVNNALHGSYSLSVTPSARPLLTDAIDWGSKLNVANGVVKIYFAAAGEVFGGEMSYGWTDYEIAQALSAASSYSSYINLRFERTTNAAEADFKLVTTYSNDFLGYFNPPGTDDAGVGVFALNGAGWSRENSTVSGLNPGGMGYLTLVHELGHGLGLAHPHDNGGTSVIMTGVLSTTDYLGYGWQNQGVYTVMSYNDGWPGGPVPASTTYYSGYAATPMAIDIAVLQAKYGANATANAGDTVYYFDAMSSTTSTFRSIWDTSGTDTLSGERFFAFTALTLDLREASMFYSGPTSGGAISYSPSFAGGLSIAAGTVIENARGHLGADTIYGNDVANRIEGLGGDDTLYGFGGDDQFIVDMSPINNVQTRVSSVVDGGTGNDTLVLNIDRKAFDQVDHGNGHFSFSDATRTIHVYNVETFTFADGKSYTAATVVNRAPSLSGSLTARVDEGQTTVLTTASLNFFDPDDTTTTFEWMRATDVDEGGNGYKGQGYLLVDGVEATTFTLAQLQAGKVVFVHSGSSDGDVHITLRAYDGQRYSAVGSLNFAVNYGIADYLVGSGLVDFINGGSGADVIIALGGDDMINGGSGNDYLVGGDGNDSLSGGSGSDFLVGEAGNDLLDASDGNDQIYAGDGDDKVYGGLGADRLIGGDGNDTLYGGAGDDFILGDAGDDIIYGEDGYSYLHGGDGNDKVFGGKNADFVIGAAGNDELRGMGDNDQLYGDIGDDQMWGDDGDDLFSGGAGMDKIYGGTGNDIAFGQDDNDTIYGDQGNDTLYGQEGADSIYGGTDDDVLSGGSGKDYLEGNAGNDSLYGDSDEDTLYGHEGNDLLSGGSGKDKLYGGIGDDTIYGDGDDDLIYGEDGNDTLIGGQGNDEIFGGIGNDTIIAQDSNDIVHGDAGNDSIYGGNHEDTLYGDDGNDFLYGEDGLDILEGGAGIDYLYGGNQNDVLRGGADNDVLYGQRDNDTLYGDAGNDALYGGLGVDTLYGGDGNDTLYGGDQSPSADSTAGVQEGDTYYGGAGADTFMIGRYRVSIKDFNAAEGDKISLSSILTTALPSTLTLGTNFFSGAGAAPTSAVATLYFDSTTNLLYYDSDGTGANAAQVIAYLENVTSLSVSDFVRGSHF